MNGEEFSIYSVCDSNINHGNNKLNDFKAPLPNHVNTEEVYAVSLFDLTYPNLMHNINRDENMMKISFFHKFHKDRPETDVVEKISGDNFRLLYQVKCPVKSSYYSGFPDFNIKASTYVTKMIEGIESSAHTNWMHLALLAVGLNNIKNPDAVMDDFFNDYERDILRVINKKVKDKVNGEFKILHAPMKTPNNVNYFTHLPYADFAKCILRTLKADPRWTGKELYHEDLLSDDAWKLWQLVPDMKTTKFKLPRMYDENPVLPGDWENMSDERHRHIIKMYTFISRLYKMASGNAREPSVKNHLMLSVKFYLCGIAFIDGMLDTSFTFDKKELEDDLKSDLWEFYGKCNEILNKGTAKSIPEEICLHSLRVLKALTKNAWDIDNMPVQGMMRVMKGVFARVRLFTDDMLAMLKYCKRITSGHTNKFNYLETEYAARPTPHEYVYINRKLKIKKPMIVAQELRKLFDRIAVTENGLVIQKYQPESNPESPPVDFIRISLSGYELQSFFGVTQPDLAVYSDRLFMSDGKPNLHHRNTNMFLYCEQIEEQYVNNVMAKVLAVIPIPWNAPYGHPIHHVVMKPTFVNLSTTHLTELRFILRNANGDLINFEDTDQTVMAHLVLRPSRKGVII